MLFDVPSIERIQNIIRKDAYAAQSYELLRKEVLAVDGEWLADRHGHMLELNRLAGNSRQLMMERAQLVTRLSELSVKAAFLYTLEPSAQLLSVAEGLMRAVCRADAWINQAVDIPGWSSDLCSAETGVHLATALDILRDCLTADFLETVYSSLEQKCLLPLYKEWLDPEDHIHALDSMGHNWWNVCISGAGVVLLVLGRKRNHRFDAILEQITDSLTEWLRYPGNVLQNKQANFGRDGDFLEYVGYFMFAFSHYCLFQEMLKKEGEAADTSIGGLEEKLAEYYGSFFHMLHDGPRLADFGDISLKIDKHAQYIFYLCGTYGKAWLQETFKQICPRMALPYEFYFYSPLPDIHSVPPPNERIFHHSGYAVVRTGFTAEDTSFMIKTGESWNHNHDDAGTFELACKGRLFITDSGCCNYGDPAYVNYYIKPEAHNVVLFNGGALPDDVRYHGTKYMGRIPVFLSADGFKYLLADCTGPFVNQFQRYYRHVIFLQDCIIMTDDLFTYEDGTLQFNLHVNGDAVPTSNRVSLHHTGERLDIHCLFPQGGEWQRQTGHSHETRNENGRTLPAAPYLQISAPTENRRGKFIHAFLLPSDWSDKIRVYAEEGEWVKEIIIERPAYTERIICNLLADGRVMHRNSCLQYKDIETDAFLVYIKSSPDGHILAAAQMNGSLLRFGGACFISSMLKSDSFVNYEDGRFTVNLTADAVCHVRSSPGPGGKLVRHKCQAGVSVNPLTLTGSHAVQQE